MHCKKTTRVLNYIRKLSFYSESYTFLNEREIEKGAENITAVFLTAPKVDFLLVKNISPSAKYYLRLLLRDRPLDEDLLPPPSVPFCAFEREKVML